MASTLVNIDGAQIGRMLALEPIEGLVRLKARPGRIQFEYRGRN